MSARATLAFAASLPAFAAAADCSIDPYCREGDVGCAEDACENRVRDGDESDVDCGGSCAPCAVGAACSAPGDCASGRCLGGACCTPPCAVWAKRFGGESVERASKAAVLADGTIVIAGVLEGTLDLGGGPLVSEGSIDLFVAAFSPEGSPRWSRRFGGSGDEGQARVAATPDGHVWFAGNFASPALDTGAGVLSASGPAGDSFVVEIDGDGQPLRARAFSSHGFGGGVVEIAATSDGGLIMAGVLGRIDFGDGTILDAVYDPAIGERLDGYVARIGPDLDRVWSRRFGDGGEDLPYAVRVAPEGDVVVLIDAETATDFGGPPLAQSGMILAAYAGADGAHRWSRGYGSAAQPAALHLGPAGAVYVTGDLLGEADLGTGKLRPRGTTDAFLARFDAEGVATWVVPISGALETHALGLLRRAEGGLVAALQVTGDIDFGSGVVTPVGVDSLILARFDEDGRIAWARNEGGIILEVPVGLADLPGGHMLAFGGFSGTLALGHTFSSAGKSDVFVAALLP